MNNEVRILHAEDEPGISLMMKLTLPRIFQRNSLNLDQVDTGIGLVEMALEKEYELILTDNDMPELSGIEALERIRKAGIRTPALMMSGRADYELSNRVSLLGNAHLLAKPYFPIDFTNKLKEILPQYFPAK